MIKWTIGRAWPAASLISRSVGPWAFSGPLLSLVLRPLLVGRTAPRQRVTEVRQAVPSADRAVRHIRQIRPDIEVASIDSPHLVFQPTPLQSDRVIVESLRPDAQLTV